MVCRPSGSPDIFESPMHICLMAQRWYPGVAQLDDDSIIIFSGSMVASWQLSSTLSRDMDKLKNIYMESLSMRSKEEATLDSPPAAALAAMSASSLPSISFLFLFYFLFFVSFYRPGGRAHDGRMVVYTCGPLPGHPSVNRLVTVAVTSHSRWPLTALMPSQHRLLPSLSPTTLPACMCTLLFWMFGAGREWV